MYGVNELNAVVAVVPVATPPVGLAELNAAVSTMPEMPVVLDVVAGPPPKVARVPVNQTTLTPAVLLLYR